MTKWVQLPVLLPVWENYTNPFNGALMPLYPQYTNKQDLREGGR